MKTLAIIGTAGRKPYTERCTLSLWNKKKKICEELIQKYTIDTLVSGGAGDTDHLAVKLFLEGKCKKLILHFPAEYLMDQLCFKEGVDKWPTNQGNIANFYHRQFQQRTGIDSLREIGIALSKGAQSTVSSGFKARNSRVADVDMLVAFTFGTHDFIGNADATSLIAGLADGGTADTYDKSAADPKIHVNLNRLEKE